MGVKELRRRGTRCVASTTLHSSFQAQDEGILPSGRRGAARGKGVRVSGDCGSLDKASPSPLVLLNGKLLALAHLACIY